jgi:tetratricopeptide (TPR) repeat protein
MSLLLDALKLEAEQKARDAAADQHEQESCAQDKPAQESELSADFAALPDSANDVQGNELPDLSSLELEEALESLEELQPEVQTSVSNEEANEVTGDTAALFDKLSFDEAPLDNASIEKVIQAAPIDAQNDEAVTQPPSALGDIPAFTESPEVVETDAEPAPTSISDSAAEEAYDTPDTSDTEWENDEEIAFGAVDPLSDKESNAEGTATQADLLQQVVQQQNLNCDDILSQLDTKNRQRRQLFMASIACGMVLLAWFFSDIFMAHSKPDNAVAMVQPAFPPPEEATQLAEPKLVPIDLATEIPMRKILRRRSAANTAALAANSVPQEPRPRLEISTRNADQSKVAAAHVALREGQISKADTLYREALRENTQSVDALNGIASIALQQQRYDDARNHFMRVLRIEPDNSYAVASVASLVQQGAQKTDLTNLAEQFPDSPAINYLLGNAHAAEQQWLHAQESYFKAYSKAPQNAQYAFNLAVSLDHLGKTTAARQFYEKALTLPNAQVLNTEAITQRLQQLEIKR